MITITLKEIRLLLRSRRAFWFLLLALLLVGGFFCLVWTQLSTQFYMGRRAFIGRMIFSAVSVLLLIALGLAAPLISATAITSERESKTLDLLITAGISRLRLLLGKWAATIYYQLVLIVCMAPMLALSFMLGGVNGDEYLFAAAVIILTILTYSMIGLACSCFFRKSASALVATLAIVLFLFIGGYILPIFLFRFLTITRMNAVMSPGSLYSIFWAFSPITCVSRLLNFTANSRGSTVLLFNNYMFITHASVQAALFLLSLCVAWRGIRRRESAGAGRAGRIIDDPTELNRRRHRWPYYLIDPQRRAQNIRDGQNPVWVKEQRIGALARPTVMIRIAYLGFPLSVLIAILMIGNQDLVRIFKGVGSFVLTLIMLFVPIFAATTLSREREENTIDLLRTSPLTSGQIVRAKFFIILRFTAVIGASLVLVPTVLVAIDGIFDNTQHSFLFLVALINLLAIYSAPYIALGIYFSSRQRRNTGALMLTYLAILAFCLAPIPMELMGQIFQIRDNALFEAVANYVMPLLSPYYHLFGYNNNAYAFWEKSVPYGIAQMGLHTALMLAISAFLLHRAARRLNKEMQ